MTDDFSSTLKVYATFSEGFRHGGVSGLPANGPCATPADLQTFKPDLAKNYDIGIKGRAFERRVSHSSRIYTSSIKSSTTPTGSATWAVRASWGSGFAISSRGFEPQRNTA
jgi:iron complex outermembrane recepter protein